tara:strand:+ start:23344 stop:23556 length:213 start_codon:yes stop_codon:yes gene_type:complete
MNNETPTIKLTGRFPNTFRVREAGDYGTDAPVEYAFEWDDGQKKHFVRISSRTAKKLTEAFEKFGYKQIR